jgi:hypothetical protein
MDYICQHLFQALTQTGKLTKVKGWNQLQKCQLERWHHIPGVFL